MLDSGQIYTCNETSESFLKLIDGRRTIGAIVDELVTEYAVNRDTLAGDFLTVALELQSEGIVQTSLDC